jgi:hypothetical protein
MNSMKELLTCAETAKLDGDITPSGVRAAERAGRLRCAARTPSGLRLFSRHDVEKWIADRRREREHVAA